jgi:hypothetical protein
MPHLGPEIGNAALGVGLGAGTYELAKNDPKAAASLAKTYMTLQIVGIVMFVTIFVVILVMTLRAVPGDSVKSPPDEESLESSLK